MTLILASTSSIRAQMLDQAGIPYRVRPPALDEDLIKQRHAGDAASLSRRLAVAKAESIAVAPDEWVIGSDSVIEVDGTRFSKPRDRGEAAAHLTAFSGRTMILSSAVALASDGKSAWSHAETARLEVRPLSPRFIESYLDAEWPAIGACAGAFRIEARGVTLFASIAGSHFTILGMPLIALLGALRERGLIAS